MQLKPKKSLGQNFLHDKNIIDKIIHASNIGPKDEILEVGPGTGNLTELIISQNPKKIIVIEKDKNLTSILEKKFLNKINIITKDILTLPVEFYSKRNFLILGNLPYNISTKILSTWCLNNELSVSKMILMFQKEVAERIIADVNSKSYSRITILSKWKFDIRKVTDVKPNSFFPKPKVHSTVLEFIPKKKIHKIEDPRNLEKITRIFFSHRRKMLKKPFNQVFNGNQKILEKLNFNLNMRPQNLDYETYYKLAQEYEKLTS